ncbi:co-chaperone YbbN [Maridesulfovibrio ferrireducens]|uniref:thioredoxin family protein n=1 Tax=Maridesulfovibrio ferrireducens TaxID=246191 RepID=UPI001A1DB557|nr:thioredoxin family protein [Maridesulfovibrio ferrireducens]MBI9111834.1 thioredoxin family protein [Maridesulfovibrio ferrireducens]
MLLSVVVPASSLANPTAEELISGAPQAIPVKGMVTMVDIGAKACVPCKMMIPVIESLSKEYEGKAAIVFIDVWKNPDEASQFGISTIPTQIFYDKDGKEKMRHTGYFSKEEIVKVLKGLGVE